MWWESKNYRRQDDEFDIGHSRISMIWVLSLGFDPYCGGKLLSLRNKFTSSINLNKKYLQKLWINFEKSRNPIISKTAQPILMAKTYVIEGTKEVMQKIREPILLIIRGQIKLL